MTEIPNNLDKLRQGFRQGLVKEVENDNLR